MSSDDNTNIKDNATHLAEAENERILLEKSGNNVHIANTYMSEIIENKRQDDKKRKEEAFKRALLRESINFDDFANEIEGLLKEYEAARDLRHRRNEAFANGDFDTWRHIMITEYHMDEDYINNLTDEEIVTIETKQNEIDIKNEADLKAHIQHIYNEYQNNNQNDLTDEQKARMKKIRSQAENLDINFDKNLSDLNTSTDSNFTRDVENIFDTTLNMSSSDRSITDPFNKVATNTTNPFDLVADNNASNLPKTVVSLPNPFD